MRKYYHEIERKLLEELQQTFYDCESRKAMLSMLLNDRGSSVEALEFYDELYVQAYRIYHEVSARMQKCTLPELYGRADFKWSADFSTKKLIVTYKGEGDPGLPSSYEEF